MYVCNENGMTLMKSTLEVKNISIEYDGESIVRDFSMHVNCGEFIAIKGVSGCGKSSLLKAILGIVPVSKGSISLDGLELSSQSIGEYRKRMAYLPQELTFPCNTVKEIIDLIFSLKVNRCKMNVKQLNLSLKKLGLDEDICNKSLSEISGGQRQRVMLAATALTAKEYILLDEPTSALDRESATAVFRFLHELEYKPAIIAVTHDDTFAALCDRVVELPKY